MNEFDKYISKYIIGYPSPMHYAMSDDDVSGTLTTQIAQRDIQYTEILKNHANLIKYRGRCKEVHKWIFFWMITFIGIVSLWYIHKILDRIISVDDIDIIIESIPIIITAGVSFTSTVIAIPLVVANFLFDSKEDDNVTALIKYTQEHDSSGITVFKDRLIGKKHFDGEKQNYEGDLDSDN